MSIFKWLTPAKRVVKPIKDQGSAAGAAPPRKAPPRKAQPRKAPPPAADLETPILAPAANLEIPILAPAADLEIPDLAPPADLEIPDLAPPADLEIPNLAPAAGQETPDLAPEPASAAELEELLLARVAALAPAANPPAPPADPQAEAGQASAAEHDGTDFENLRRLIMGRDLEGLESIRQRLDDPELLARTLCPAVTEALFLRAKADRKLDVVLKATVERILRSSVRRNPGEMADHLFPAMGPAIRKSIAESLRGMLQDLSRLLEKSVSLTGLKWRLTALRTGRPFSEVVLLNSLEYQVEQVFLVHTRTGAALAHLVNQGVRVKDASGDQVAAMFTALQQFVADSFAEGELNDLSFGDLHISVVQGPEVYLACVVRGQAPPKLRRAMRSILELLVVDLAEELENFQGDLAPFQRSRRLLESLLVSRRKDEDRKPSPAALLILALIAAIVFGPTVHQAYQNHKARREAEAEAAMERRVHKATASPGLSLVKAWRRPDGIWEMTFLKDDLAEGPEEKLTALGLSPGQARLTFLPYMAQDRELVERRAGLILAGRPETLACDFDWSAQTLVLSGQGDLNRVLAAYDALQALPGVRAVQISGLVDQETGIKAELGRDQVLRLYGRASIPWREDLKERAAAIYGLSRLDLSHLEDDAASLHLKELLGRVNGVVIYFPVGQDQPLPENQALLRRTAEDLVALEKLAKPMGLNVSLVIYGYTDPSGQAKQNYDLSQARARALAALLYERGSTITLSTFGLGSGPEGEADDDPQTQKKATAQARRRIELSVKLDRSPAFLNLD